MFRKLYGYLTAAACAGFALCTTPAAAQLIPWNTPLLSATVPQDAKGIPLGAFRLYPALEVTGSYDDNIYRTQTGTKDDFIVAEIPGFVLQSGWSRHLLELYGSFDGNQYLTHGSEDNNNWSMGGDGRLDIVRSVDLVGGGSYTVLHLARTSPDQPGNAKSPTEFATTQGNAAFEYHPYHFSFTVGGTYTRWDYDPTKMIGLPDLSNADRNEDLYTGFVKGSYEFSPGYAAYVQATYNDAVYDLHTDRTGLHRNNNGATYVAGLDMLVTDLIKGQVFVGYLSQNYKAPLVNISGFDWGANVDWDASPLWTFHLTASRMLNGTTIALASAEDDESVRVGVDYSLRRNVLLQAHVGYIDSVFNGSSRDDKYTDAGLGAQYMMNEHASLQLNYDFQHRNSTVGGQNFDDSTVSLGLNLHI